MELTAQLYPTQRRIKGATRLGQIVRNFVLERIGGENNIHLPTVQAYENVLALDGKICNCVEFDELSKQVSWSRELSDGTFEHGLLSLDEHGSWGNGSISITPVFDSAHEAAGSKTTLVSVIIDSYTSNLYDTGAAIGSADEQQLFMSINYEASHDNVAGFGPGDSDGDFVISKPHLSHREASSANQPNESEPEPTVLSEVSMMAKPLLFATSYDEIALKADQKTFVSPKPFGDIEFGVYRESKLGIAWLIFKINALDKLLLDIDASRSTTSDPKLDALYYSIVYTGDDGKTRELVELCDAALITGLADSKDDANDGTLTFKDQLSSDVKFPILFNRMDFVMDLHGSDFHG